MGSAYWSPSSNRRLGAVSIAAFVLLVVARGFQELADGPADGGGGLPAITGLLDLGWALVGIGVLGWSFLLCFGPPGLGSPVAEGSSTRTGLDGRGRTGLPLVFIVVMLVVLPSIPLSLILTRLLSGANLHELVIGLGLLAGRLDDVALGCSTIATEIRDRQFGSGDEAHFAFAAGGQVAWLGGFESS